MTQEEKARAYDEALERARKIHNQTEFDYEKGMMEEVFPELAESEDERIRKAILNFLMKMWGNCQDDVCGVNVEDAIAWLEKQSEKPAWSEEDEQIMLSTEQVMNCASLLNLVPEKIDKVKSWLKTLKQRIGE